jgi:hypothetical protein
MDNNLTVNLLLSVCSLKVIENSLGFLHTVPVKLFQEDAKAFQPAARTVLRQKYAHAAQSRSDAAMAKAAVC